MSSRRRFAVAPLVLALSLFGCGTASPAAGARDDGPVGSTAQAIKTSDVMAQAALWVADAVPYCGGIRGGADAICGGTCSRPSAAWNAYRSDCSGFVSWCWQIASDPTTSEYMVDTAGADGWATVKIEDMQPGDAFVCDGHIKLFSKFVSATEAEIYEESDCGKVASKSTQTFTRSGETLTFAYDTRVYHPIRRNGIVNDGAGGAAYGAQYVSQSWPLASTAMKMTAGEDVAASIVLKNVGSKSWDSNTKLATSNPRDRASDFVGKDWLANNRLAAVSGSIAPGATYEFKFTFHAPATPGSYHEYFNLVEEGTAWFSDPSQGGPADDVIEAYLEVAAAPAGTDAGASADAGRAGDDGGGGSDATPASGEDAGAGAGGGAGGGSSGVDGGGATRGAATGANGGCSIAEAGAQNSMGQATGPNAAPLGGLLAAWGLALGARRRRRC